MMTNVWGPLMASIFGTNGLTASMYGYVTGAKATAIANRLMDEFSPDTIPNKYLKAHKAVCEHYGFEETNTIHIALAPRATEYDEFHRDDYYNRINIAKALKRYKTKGNFYDNI